ncbi:kinase-like protein [Gigaspora margarita]|uniref:Kinase-like protein n=1 Tax=Gigaspora margarita TaxID=4874 RepID=A0A8H4ER12_GIGMA|nr:kinase-like protein [Gigaspora margarita]
MSGKEFFDAGADILTVYVPVISAVKALVGEIYQIYENAECNKVICAVMVGRVKAAEFSMDKIVRSIEKTKEDFNKKSYYYAFEKFKNNLTQIKEYCKNVSKLKGYKRFLHANNVKSRFEQLKNDFDRCMADLNFARAEESRVDASLKEVKESLEQLDDKLNEGFNQVDEKLDDGNKQVCDKLDLVAQRIDFMQLTKQGDEKNNIDPDQLDDPMKPIIRGRVFKKIYKSLMEVACKPIDVVNNSQIMVIEWAERGNLRELYNKHDIPWTRKIQIAKDILLGLLFLRTVNVFHHDIRCENVFVLKDLSVKLGNFGCVREVDGNSSNVSRLATYIVRWMAPELIKKYISSHYENKRVYTFNCEMFSFGMLLWELCYEKLPYGEWNIKQISEHVLAGKREKILKGKFANPIDREIQLEFMKIIQDVWCHQPELRITIPALRQRLEDLANKFPILDDAPELLEKGEFIPEINDYPDEFDEIPEEVEDDDAVIPLKDAKFWVGYYLLYGHHGEKDPIQARKYFKEAADENNHAESQCRYAVALLPELGKETDETAKVKLRKEILYYFELAAENPENRNADAMYYLGDIYVAGKLKVKKDEERGLNYLRLAANNKNERAVALLKKLGKYIK